MLHRVLVVRLHDDNLRGIAAGGVRRGGRHSTLVHQKETVSTAVTHHTHVPTETYNTYDMAFCYLLCSLLFLLFYLIVLRRLTHIMRRRFDNKFSFFEFELLHHVCMRDREPLPRL